LTGIIQFFMLKKFGR